MGGLSAAVELSARPGWEVTVLEAASSPGGKIGVADHDGVSFDTGPSLLTLPDVLEELLASRGRRLESLVTLTRPDPSMRYRFAGGEQLEVKRELEGTRHEVEQSLGKKARRDFDAFLGYARKIWEAAAPHFVFGPAPTALTAVKLGVKAMRDFIAIDAKNTMMSALDSRVEDRRIRDLFLRYATFNGSDPRHAPATLHCIGWVDLGIGGWGVKGGMTKLATALERVAREGGVDVKYDSPVRSIRKSDGTFEVQWEGGSRRVDAVIVNACAQQLVERLWQGDNGLGLRTDGIPSTSAFTAVIRARRRADRPAHALAFPDRDYMEEFVDLFDRGEPPKEPAIYLCAREKAHGAEGWADDETLFVMTNTPALSELTTSVDWEQFEARVLTRLRRLGWIDEGDRVVWRRTPQQLAARFPCSQGSLYGSASNSRLAAFRRPPNRAPGVSGLYLAGGSAHPGGGVPLCVQSGRQAASELLADCR